MLWQENFSFWALREGGRSLDDSALCTPRSTHHKKRKILAKALVTERRSNELRIFSLCFSLFLFALLFWRCLMRGCLLLFCIALCVAFCIFALKHEKCAVCRVASLSSLSSLSSCSVPSSWRSFFCARLDLDFVTFCGFLGSPNVAF